MTALVHKLNMTRPVALNKVRELAQRTECVVYLPHAAKRMRERKIDGSQVFSCLRMGQITEGPFIANKSGLWHIRIERFAAGEEICLAVECSEDPDGLLIITVFE